MKLPMRTFSALVAFALCCSLSADCFCQDDEPPTLSVEGELVDFLRDVKPVLDAKCLSCHGPEDAKNDFRVDDHDVMLDYLEPGDVESSSLWTDYLVTDDEDMRMPPPGSDVSQLSGTELATLKLWIEEGAKWREGGVEQAAEEPVAELSDAAKWWRLQGMFHPASVHFPIALLVVSTLFVVLSFLNRESFEPVAFHCLWIGALGAVASCVMGWAYAQSQGYGDFSFDLQNSSIDRHRWMGIAVAVLGLVLIPMARSVRRTGDTGMRLMWMVGSIIALGAVSIAGYQGGELTYGEDHYLNEYNRLFPSEVVAEDNDENADDSEASDSDETLVSEDETETSGDQAAEVGSEESESGSDAEAPTSEEASAATEKEATEKEATESGAAEEVVVEKEVDEGLSTGSESTEEKASEESPAADGTDSEAGSVDAAASGDA